MKETLTRPYNSSKCAPHSAYIYLRAHYGQKVHPQKAGYAQTLYYTMSGEDGRLVSCRSSIYTMFY